MHVIPTPAAATARRAALRRCKGLAMLSAAALLLHVAALGGVGWAWPERTPEALPADAVQLRVIEAPERVMAPRDAPAARSPLLLARADEPAARPRSPVPARPAAKPVVADAVMPALTVAAPLPPALEQPVQLALNTPPAASAAATPTLNEPAGSEEPLPHYRTRMPPAMTLRYELSRGMLKGSGELSWKPQGDHYELKLDGRVASLAVLTQVSSGGFDAAGIAPDRFTDQRLRRAAVAANFQRAAGKITFSSVSNEYPIRAGVQDRLSWMVQLAAIVSADPQLRTTGAKVVMYVIGAHGEADVWAFRCGGVEQVETGNGTVAAVKYARVPNQPNDTDVQVWLDPKQNDLPVRAVQQSGPNDEPFELRLLSVSAGS